MLSDFLAPSLYKTDFSSSNIGMSRALGQAGMCCQRCLNNITHTNSCYILSHYAVDLPGLVLGSHCATHVNLLSPHPSTACAYKEFQTHNPHLTLIPYHETWNTHRKSPGFFTLVLFCVFEKLHVLMPLLAPCPRCYYFIAIFAAVSVHV